MKTVSPLPPPVRLEALHCRMLIVRPAHHIVLVSLSGSDIGEFGDAPFRELARDLERGGALDLFIDARDTRGATIDVSNDWALWLHEHRDRLERVTMLTATRLIAITADQVRRFAGLGERMHLTNDPAEFDGRLVEAIRSIPVPG